MSPRDFRNLILGTFAVVFIAALFAGQVHQPKSCTARLNVEEKGDRL